MAIGKLYLDDGEQPIGEVDYQLYDESLTGWWGELVLTEYRRMSDGNGYILELGDGRRGRCSLKKRVNKAVSGLQPLYYYRFQGLEMLK